MRACIRLAVPVRALDSPAFGMPLIPVAVLGLIATALTIPAGTRVHRAPAAVLIGCVVSTCRRRVVGLVSSVVGSADMAVGGVVLARGMDVDSRCAATVPGC
jgi:hypothetical protein